MFKLLEIEFINHPFFKSLPVKLVGEGEEKASHYKTLIIGPNGTGKSQILLAAVSIFNSLENFTKKKSYSFPYEYAMRFVNDGQLYRVEYRNKKLTINDKPIRNGVKDIGLPSKVLVSAFSFNDKYPLRESRGKVINENYHYLGLKSTTNNIFIFNPPKNAILNLYNAVLKKKDILPLKEAFTTLELKPEIKLIYKPGKYFKFLQNNEFWENRKLSQSQFSTSFSDFIKKRKRKTNNTEPRRLGSEKISKLLEDKEKLDILIEFLKDNIRLVTDISNKELSIKPLLDFDEKNSYDEFTKQVQPLQLLNDLELISFERFEIRKLKTNFSFDDASSGEYHIILTFLNILSLIEEDSLVLLDEPEISLHPNWQIKYMGIFNKIFQRFPKTHFILASHSHFLVSDLKSENSFILGIDVNENGNIKITPTEKNTYGWSAEQILLDVFKVASTRNYYISKTITDVLNEMSEEKPNFQLIKEKLKSVIFLETKDFNEHDPLLEIFKKLKEFYNELNNA